MYLSKMQLLFRKLLPLETVSLRIASWGFSIFGGPLGQTPCAWIVSISGQEIRKGKVRDKRKQVSAVGSAK